MTDQDDDILEDFDDIEDEDGGSSNFVEGAVDDVSMIFEGKKYAVGLFWLVNDEMSPVSLAKDRAKMLQADFYCVRDSVISQQGFGFLKNSHRMSMPSAAAIVADALVGEWHAILKADNGWWYIAVHGDAIAPRGDIFFTDEEAAYNHFKIECEKYKWPRMYAPKDWDIPNITAELFLERLLEEPTNVTLKPVTLDAVFAGRRNKIIAGIGFLLFLGLIGLFSFLPSLISSNLQTPQPVMDVSKISVNINNIKAPPKKKEEIEITNVLSSLSLPKPSTVIATCGGQLAKIVRPIPGWDIFKAECINRNVIVQWRRRLGSLDLLLKTAGIFPKNSKVRFENDTFIVTMPLPNLSALNRPNTPLLSKEIQLLLNSRLNDAGDLILSLKRDKPQKENSNIFEATGAIEAKEVIYLDLKFKTRVAPQVVASYFDAEGIEMQLISWDFRSGDWTYNAKVHLEQEEKG